MILTAVFTESWVPREWLTPVVTILEVKTGKVIADWVPMEEVWRWFYRYNFIKYKENIDYAILYDWWDQLQNTERYKASGNENNIKLAEIAGNTSLTLVNSAKKNKYIDYDKIRDMIVKDFPKMDIIEEKVKTIDELQQKFNKIEKIDILFNSIKNMEDQISKIRADQESLDLSNLF